MNIGGIGGAAAPRYQTPSSRSVGSAPTASGSDPASSSDPAQAFLDYMKKTPAQRMVKAWLAAHHLTQQQLDAMPPAQRTAIERQMAQDIQNETREKAKQKPGATVDLIA
jgi:hypothetical protein